MKYDKTEMRVLIIMIIMFILAFGVIIAVIIKEQNLLEATSAMAALFSALAAGLTFVSQTIFSQAQKEITKIQLMRANFDAWKDIDMFFLQNEESLKHMVATCYPKSNQADKVKELKSDFVRFLRLNPLYSYFYVINSALEGDEESLMKEKFNNVLREFLKDDKTAHLAKNYVFVEGFSQHCDKLIQEMNKT